MRQHVRVNARVHPAKQARRLCGEGATRGQRQLHAACARHIQPRADALCVPAQLPLIDTPGQRFLQQRRRRQRREQLGVGQPLHQIRRCRQKPDTPVRRQDLGKATDINGALQTVQRTQARGMVGCKMAVGVVLNNVKVVRIGQLQHAIRTAR